LYAFWETRLLELSDFIGAEDRPTLSDLPGFCGKETYFRRSLLEKSRIFMGLFWKGDSCTCLISLALKVDRGGRYCAPADGERDGERARERERERERRCVCERVRERETCGEKEREKACVCV